MLVSADGSELVENFLLLIGIGDRGVLKSGLLLLNWHGDTLRLRHGSNLLELVGGGISHETLLGLGVTLGEQNKFAKVGLKSIHVHIKLLLAGAGSSVVNGDTNGSCVLDGDTSVLKLGQSKAAAHTDLTSVLLSALRHNGAEGVSGSGEDAGSLSLSDLMSLSLLGGLVEVTFDSNTFPVLSKMHVDNHVVMLDHC